MRRALLTLWAPFLAALAIVFWLSSQSDVPGGQYYWDKAMHVIGYSGLGILAMRAFHGGFTPPRLAPTLCAGAAVILWGISDEFHQSFVPGRDSSAWDVVADAVGFAIAAAIVALATSRTRRSMAAR